MCGADVVLKSLSHIKNPVGASHSRGRPINDRRRRFSEQMWHFPGADVSLGSRRLFELNGAKVRARLRNVWAQSVQRRWFNPHVHLQPRGREGLDADLWTQYDCKENGRHRDSSQKLMRNKRLSRRAAQTQTVTCGVNKASEISRHQFSGASEEPRAAGWCYACDPDAPTLTPWNTPQRWAALVWLLLHMKSVLMKFPLNLLEHFVSFRNILFPVCHVWRFDRKNTKTARLHVHSNKNMQETQTANRNDASGQVTVIRVIPFVPHMLFQIHHRLLWINF